MKTITVKAARTQTDVDNGQCDVVLTFDTLKEARKHAQYYVSEAFRVSSEASERLGYSAVYVDGECVSDYFAL